MRVCVCVRVGIKEQVHGQDNCKNYTREILIPRWRSLEKGGGGRKALDWLRVLTVPQNKILQK